MRRFWIVVGLFLPTLAFAPTLTVAAQPANEHFQHTWERTDKPVADGAASRTWMWGPDAFTGALQEAYAESPSGMRTVQYFDKSRMEITQPDNDPNMIWYVTNGLLVLELMEGRIQTGEGIWQEHYPAFINLAGDIDDPDGPTYGTFNNLRNELPSDDGATITQRVDRNGVTSAVATLATYGVVAAHRVQVPGINHQVASPFWDFMNSSGLVWESGQSSVGTLFENPFFATGLPLTEAYWSTIAVGGTPKEVLIQCFERRCLTYTPENPEGWRVESGNVGLHYYQWRYGNAQEAPAIDGRIVFETNFDGCNVIFVCSTFHVVNLDGSGVMPLTEQPINPVFTPRWSPDGSQLLYASQPLPDGEGTPGSPYIFDELDLFVMDVDSGTVRQLASFPGSDRYASWSPDGHQIAFESERDGDRRLYIMDVDTGDVRRLAIGGQTAWSPNGRWIAVLTWEGGGVRTLWLVDAVTGQRELLLDPVVGASSFGPLSWSSDSSTIAFEKDEGIFTIAIDGSGLRQLTAHGQNPRWSKDGHYILFSWNWTGDLYAMHAYGGSPWIVYSGEKSVSDYDLWQP